MIGFKILLGAAACLLLNMAPAQAKKITHFPKTQLVLNWCVSYLNSLQHEPDGTFLAFGEGDEVYRAGLCMGWVQGVIDHQYCWEEGITFDLTHFIHLFVQRARAYSEERDRAAHITFLHALQDLEFKVVMCRD